MSKEELLKPRYKVIADYPNQTLEIGEIIYGDDNGIFYVYEDNGRWRLAPEAYPAIFKPLQWWEEREEKDMPEYLTYQFMPDSHLKVIRVGNHFTNSAGNPNRFGFIAQDDFYSYSKTTPATEQEYNDYINSKATKP